MIFYPNAKLNVGLRVVGKRFDGYHDIYTTIVPVPLFDILEISESANHVRPTYSGRSISSEQEFLSQLYGYCRNQSWIPNLSWHLHKQIPIGLGLGGGSSDLAVFATYLYRFPDIQSNWTKVLEVMTSISTDSQFFLMNQPAEVRGKGDDIRPCANPLKGYYVALFLPKLSISTVAAFRWFDQQEIQSKSQEQIGKKMLEPLMNDFEPLILEQYPEYGVYRQILRKLGALSVSVTGTGSGFYAVFADHPILQTSDFPEHFIFRVA